MATLTTEHMKVIQNDLKYKDGMVRKLLKIHDATKDEKAKEALLNKANKWSKKVELVAQKLI